MKTLVAIMNSRHKVSGYQLQAKRVVRRVLYTRLRAAFVGGLVDRGAFFVFSQRLGTAESWRLSTHSHPAVLLPFSQRSLTTTIFTHRILDFLATPIGIAPVVVRRPLLSIVF